MQKKVMKQSKRLGKVRDGEWSETFAKSRSRYVHIHASKTLKLNQLIKNEYLNPNIYKL
jgi:hypothetical protein